MDDPTYGVIYDVDPDVGADYTTLQAWFAGTLGDIEVPHARCHHSDVTSLGALTTIAGGWAYTPTAAQPVCIYAANGEEADGSQNDELQGSAIVAAVVGVVGLNLNWPAVTIAQLRITMKAAGCTGIQTETDSVLIKQVTIIIDGSPPGCSGIFIIEGTAATSCLGNVENSFILNRDSANAVAGIVFVAAAGSSTCNGLAYANSIANCTAIGFGGGMVGLTINVGDTVNIEARNNVVVDDGTIAGPCFASLGAGVVNWNDCDYNVSSDNTADVLLGGANNVINAVIGNVWADITDNDTPFAPLVGGDLDPPDGDNLYDDGIVEDGRGEPRPDGVQYRGAYTLYTYYGIQIPVDYAIETTRPGFPIPVDFAIETTQTGFLIACSYRLVAASSYTVRLYTATSPPVLYKTETIAAIDLISPEVVFTGVADGTYLVTVEADFGGLAELVQSKWFYMQVDSAESDQVVVIVPGPDEPAGPYTFVVTQGWDSQGSYLEWNYPWSADDLDFYFWFVDSDPSSGLVIPAEDADFVMPGFLGQSYYKFYLYDNSPWIIVAAKKNSIWSEPQAINVGAVTLTQEMQPHPED